MPISVEDDDSNKIVIEHIIKNESVGAMITNFKF